MKTSIATRVVTIVGLAIGAFAISALAQSSTWSSAPGNPPNCPSGTPGCDAPLNVGPSPQSKPAGLVGLGSLVVTNLQVLGGIPGSGKVLTSDASGNVSWQTPAVSTGCAATTSFGPTGLYSGTNTSGHEELVTAEVPYNANSNADDIAIVAYLGQDTVPVDEIAANDYQSSGAGAPGPSISFLVPAGSNYYIHQYGTPFDNGIILSGTIWDLCR